MSLSRSHTIALTLEKLLSYEDKHFINNAYHVLLGREPDSEGMSYYLNRMRTGIGKIEILAQLRNSTEGKSRPVKIIGLNEAIRLHKQLKIPLLGSLLRLAGLKQEGNGKQKNVRAINNEIASNFIDLLEQHGIYKDDLPQTLSLETIHCLNPNDHFNDIYQALSAIVQQSPIRKLRIHNEDELNAKFYVKLAINHEIAGRIVEAVELYRLSLLFFNTPMAHEHLGNLALDVNRCYQAAEHYKTALDLKSQSPWVYVNLAKAQAMSGNYKEAVETVCAGINAHPGSELLMSKIDESVLNYWQVEDQKLDFVAATQNREKLIIKYENIASFICNSYAKVFRRNSSKAVNVRINESRVLIIGLTPDAAECVQ